MNGDRIRLRVFRATAAAAAGLFGAVGAAGTAMADPAQHSTEVFTGTFTFDSPVTCGGGPLYTQTQNVTFIDNLVTTSGQTLHDRGTFDISFTGVPLDSALPTVTGTSHGSAAFNLSQVGAAEETGSATTTATYSDGTTVTAKETIHFTVRHDGHLVTSFDRCVSSPQ